MSSISIYEMDIDSNPEFIKAIGGIRDKKADILAYNPATRQYTRLNKKLTRNLIVQFLKALVKKDKRLKMVDGEVLKNIIIRRKDGKVHKKKQEKVVHQEEKIETKDYEDAE